VTGRKIGVLIVLGMTFLSCTDGRGGVENISVPSRDGNAGSPNNDHPGRLTARPKQASGATARPGLRRFRIAPGRECYLLVPATYKESRPSPFILALHGAGGNSRGALRLFAQPARTTGAVLFAPQAAGSTWDLMRGGFAADVDFLDRALESIFNRYAIDPERVVVGGFSDGASYALSLGIANGDLFRKIIALSPGFVAPGPPHGRPKIFIAHGRDDQVLPFDSTSNRIVPVLRDYGYDVTFRVHPEGHIPGPRLDEAADWYARG
jgi:phospholipase/carboxylesterase